MKLEDVILRDTRANQPLATDVPVGTLYFVTDETITERSSGTAWESYTDATGTSVHATTHNSGGSDPVTITSLAGYPGGTSSFLRADGTFAAPVTSAIIRRQVTLVIDGGTSVITTGVKGYASLPTAGTWKKWRILSTDGISGSITIDIWKDTYTNYPPDVADTITAAAKPSVTGATKNEDSALTGWTTAFSAGDVIGFNVDSVTTFQKISLTLEFE